MRRAVGTAIAGALLLAGCSSTVSGKHASLTQPSPSPTSNSIKSIAPSDIAAASSAAAAASSQAETAETETTEPAGPLTPSVGQSITVTNENSIDSMKITVTKVRTATVEPGEFGTTPDHGLYVIINVKAVGIGPPIDVNPFDFYLLGANGAHYEDAEYSDAWGAAFDSGTLHKGEHISGTLVYDAATRAKHGRIYYSPNFDGEPIAYWKY